MLFWHHAHLCGGMIQERNGLDRDTIALQGFGHQVFGFIVMDVGLKEEKGVHANELLLPDVHRQFEPVILLLRDTRARSLRLIRRGGQVAHHEVFRDGECAHAADISTRVPHLLL